MRGFAPQAWRKGGRSTSQPTAQRVCLSTATISLKLARLSSSSQRETARQVANFINQTTMSNQRFTITPSANSMWTVADTESGFSIKFREGLFNETQQVIQPNHMPEVPEGVEPAVFFAGIMSAIGDYMAQEHPYIATCDIYARRSALWMLSHESWWITLVAACNSLLIDPEEGDLTDNLFMELDDFFNLSHENPAELEDNEKSNLLGAVSLLDEDEADEVFKLIHIYWHEYADSEYDTETWARDLLWWPCYANTIIDKLEAEQDGNSE